MSSDAIPNLYRPLPECPRCRQPATTPSDDVWRCERCRLVWDRHGTNGRKDARTPRQRLRDAYDAHARTDMSAAAFADAVGEYLTEASIDLRSDICDTVYDIATTDLSVIRDVVEHAAPGYLADLDSIIARLREVSQ